MARLLPLELVLLLGTLATYAQAPAARGQSRTPNSESRVAAPAFSVVEASIDEMRLAMEQGRTTSRDIVTQSLVRIATYEDRLNAAITINPRALAEADERDRERKAGRIRGPLHGIPVALKDNIHTTDMPTTGGALAFARLVPPYEATLTRNLREAGAVIIAKTVMTELANWVSDRMPTNYSSLAGFGFNPYDPRRDPRDGADGRPVLRDRRLELRHRHRGELLGGKRRHGNVGLDPQPVEPDDARGHQADGRPHQPLRRDPDRRRPGHTGSDGQVGDRRRDPARRRSKAPTPDPNDAATDNVRRSGGTRLQETPEA